MADEEKGPKSASPRARGELSSASRIVVKIGTRLVARRTEGIDGEFLERLALQIANLQARGVEVVVVTSGAVHLGRCKLGSRGRGSVSQRQAMAAVGQPELMRHYIEAFERHGLTAAQLLLTAEDMVHRERYLNVRNTIEALLHDHIVPVINENDSVSIEGVTFGENDRLAALVAIKVRADVLVFLSDQPGLLTGDPRRDAAAKLVPEVHPDDDVSGYAGGPGGPESAGGMAKKIEAARTAADCGIAVVLADGRQPDVLTRVLSGEEIGTLFIPRRHLEARKAWLATTAEPAGVLVIDDGARDALLAPDGASLLPVGVKKVHGQFERGDMVVIEDMQGQEVARGLVNYSADELRRIAGLHTDEIPLVLGRRGDDEAVHRNNMVITATRTVGR
ncbi:MAG: glutamate 5-kinase [Armatimonadetes bacterium]|nr:glutamate 5-kinase [Armatimonadota bacterium]